MRVLLFFFSLPIVVFSQNTDSLLFEKRNSKIHTNKLTIGNQDLYNTQTDYENFMELEAMPDSECTSTYSSYYNPLSLIGIVYSYEWGYSDEAACGPPSNSLGVKTISIETGEEISVLEIVKEKDFVAAFKNDGWVRRMLVDNGVRINNLESLQEIIELLAKDMTGISFTPSSFCILGFAHGKVKIRFIASEYMGYNHSKHLQLGFELPVKKAILPLFSDDTNFYLGEFENGIKSKS